MRPWHYLVAALLILCLAVSPVAAAPKIWLDQYDNRFEMKISADAVDEDLTDFPVMLTLSRSAGTNDAYTELVFDELRNDANRKKIMVTDAMGNPLYVEIKEWDTAARTAYLWVKVPHVSSHYNTVLYFYYDRDVSDNTQYVGDTGEAPAQAVWSAGFAGVWHMNPIQGTKKILYSSEMRSTRPGGYSAYAGKYFVGVDCSGLTKQNGWLKIDMKCDNPQYLSPTDSYVDMTSSGDYGQNAWRFSNVGEKLPITTSYQTFYIPLSEFDSVGGELNPTNINYIEWDNYILPGAPDTTIYWRNAEIVSTAALPSGSDFGVVLDSTANGNHGMIYGATEVDGPLGTALAFDGVDDYTSVPGAAPTDPSSGSASILFTRAWATNDNVTHGLMCIGGYVSSAHIDFKRLLMFKWGGDNNWFFRLSGDDGSAQVNVPDSEIPADVPTYVTMAWANGLVSVYVNGVLAGTFAQAAPSTWLTNHVELGRAYEDDVMHGQIMGAWVSSVAHSPAWIAAQNAVLTDTFVAYDLDLSKRASTTFSYDINKATYLGWLKETNETGVYLGIITSVTKSMDDVMGGMTFVLIYVGALAIIAAKTESFEVPLVISVLIMPSFSIFGYFGLSLPMDVLANYIILIGIGSAAVIFGAFMTFTRR